MTLYDFNTLSLDQKQKSSGEMGSFSITTLQKKRCNVYALGKFFVEVVYDGEHNVITELRVFKTGHPLDKYSIDF